MSIMIEGGPHFRLDSSQGPSELGSDLSNDELFSDILGEKLFEAESLGNAVLENSQSTNSDDIKEILTDLNPENAPDKLNDVINRLM